MSDFQADISAFVKKAKGNTDKVVRKIILDVGTRIVLRSPVGDAKYWKGKPPKGYVGGRFRGNWQYGFGVIPTGELPNIDKNGSSTIGKLASGVLASPVAGLHYLVNNLPYAKRIEEGWSHRQAPQGVVGLTILEFKAIVEKAAANVN